MTFAEAGNLIDGRYQLTKPFLVPGSSESSQAGIRVEAWNAIDTFRSAQVRLLLLDPGNPATVQALDAARRTAIFSSSRAVRVLSVSESGQIPAWICTELPYGEPLLTFFNSMPFPPAQIHAVCGEIATTLSGAREHGIRHLALNPSCVYVDLAGEVFIDGFGYAAFLAGIPHAVELSRDPLFGVEADRLEARGIVGLAASMLVGDPTVPAHQAIAEGAGDPDLDDQLRLVFSRENTGEGSLSPAELIRELAPWPYVAPHQFPRTQEEFGWAPPPVFATPTHSSLAQKAEQTTAPTPSTSASAPSPDEDALTFDEDESLFPPLHTDDEVALKTRDEQGDETKAEDFMNEREPEALKNSEAYEQKYGKVVGTAEDDNKGKEIDKELGFTPPEAPPVTPHWIRPKDFAEDETESDDKDEEEDYEEKAPQTVVLPSLGEGESPLSEVESENIESNMQVEESQPRREIESGVHPEPEVETPLDSGASLESTVSLELEAEPEHVRSSNHDHEPDPECESTSEMKLERPHTQSPVAGSSADKKKRALTQRAGIAGIKGSLTRRRGITRPGRTTSRRSLSWIFTTGAAALVVIGGIWAVTTFFSPTKEVVLPKPKLTSEPSMSAGSATPAPTPTQPSVESLPAPIISSIALLNPQGAQLDPATVAEQDSPATVTNAIDSNPNTVWRSWWYSNPNFVRKEGIGLEVKLAAESRVSEVNLQVNGEGGNVQWRNTTATAPNGGNVIAEGAMSSSTALKASEPIATDTVILWFTQLPTDNEGRYRISLAQVQVK